MNRTHDNLLAINPYELASNLAEAELLTTLGNDVYAHQSGNVISFNEMMMHKIYLDLFNDLYSKYFQMIKDTCPDQQVTSNNLPPLHITQRLKHRLK